MSELELDARNVDGPYPGGSDAGDADADHSITGRPSPAAPLRAGARPGNAERPPGAALAGQRLTGSAQPRRRPLIIERPDLQTAAQRYGYLSVTFLAWFMWLYLVVPLLSLLAWVAGITVLYEAMIQNLATADLLAMLKVYGSGAGALSLIYLTWAITSYLRWRNVHRRQPAAPVDDQRLASSHHLTPAELHALRTASRRVLSVELLERMFAAPRAADRRVNPKSAA
ncbi:MAG: poly-beta-1,6-N-acetyl-D-glucosamine biosynthesis protein PgaD [Pseudomonadales bacterium]